MSAIARAVLVDALERHLFPALRAQGFAGPTIEQDERDPEHAQVGVAYHFRRTIVGAPPWVVTVYVKPASRPTFAIMGGQVPPEGVRMLDPPERFPPDRVTADMLPERTELLSVPGKQRFYPFRQPLLAFLMGSTAGIERSVRSSLQRLPALIAWIERRERSPWIFVMRWRPPGAELP